VALYGDILGNWMSNNNSHMQNADNPESIRLSDSLVANHGYPLTELNISNIPDNITALVDAIRTAADEGNSKAMTDLGLIALYGLDGTDADPKTAAYWYRLAADNDDPEAQCGLGILYATGNGVGQDHEKALEWYTAASKHGNVRSYIGLADAYFYGRGVKRDCLRSAGLYRLAAEHGDPYSLSKLGRLKLEGWGVEQDFAEAAKWYSFAAEQGDADSQYCLGFMHEHGLGVEQSYSEAAEWYGPSSEHGDRRAAYALGKLYFDGDGIDQDHKEAERLFRMAGEKGCLEAQIRLGMLYSNNVFGINHAESAKWYTLAAEQGDRDSQSIIGRMYYDGSGVEQSYEKAAEWYTLAAEQGDVFSRRSLGAMYSEGRGVEQSYEETVKWYLLAARQGDAESQYNLGIIYEYGRSVDQDYEEAVRWYTLAADRDIAGACVNLGIIYEYGRGVEQSYDTAMEHYRSAADLGDPRGECALGAIYERGSGVRQDHKKAFDWYTKAANRNDTEGQYSLGSMYEYGKGVNQDYRMAVEWYSKAADQGHEASTERMRMLLNSKLADLIPKRTTADDERLKHLDVCILEGPFRNCIGQETDSERKIKLSRTLGVNADSQFIEAIFDGRQTNFDLRFEGKRITAKCCYELKGEKYTLERELRLFKKEMLISGSKHVDLTNVFFPVDNQKDLVKAIKENPEKEWDLRWACFDGDEFGGNISLRANFNRASFLKGAKFQNTFPDPVDFGGTIFMNVADFKSSKFREKARFSNMCAKIADFYMAEFLDSSIFSNVSADTLDFVRVSFRADVFITGNVGILCLRDSIIKENADIAVKGKDHPYSGGPGLEFDGSIGSKARGIFRSGDESADPETEYSTVDISGLSILGILKMDWKYHGFGEKKANPIHRAIKRRNNGVLDYADVAEQFQILKVEYGEQGAYDYEDEAFVAHMMAKNKVKIGKNVGWWIKRKDRIGKGSVSFLNIAGRLGTNPMRVFLFMLVIPFAFWIFLLSISILANDGVSAIDNLSTSWVAFLTVGLGVGEHEGLRSMIFIIEGFIGMFFMAYFTVSVARRTLR
jgi:TPR repeat protein